jgi:hypothetical protein
MTSIPHPHPQDPYKYQSSGLVSPHCNHAVRTRAPNKPHSARIHNPQHKSKFLQLPSLASITNSAFTPKATELTHSLTHLITNPSHPSGPNPTPQPDRLSLRHRRRDPRSRIIPRISLLPIFLAADDCDDLCVPRHGERGGREKGQGGCGGVFSERVGAVDGRVG